MRISTFLSGPDCATIPGQEPHMKDSSQPEFSRRQLLRTGLTATAAAFLTGGRDLAFPSQAQAQSKLTPDAALAELMDGNKRFTSGGMTAYEQDLAILKQHTEQKQEPFAAVLLGTKVILVMGHSNCGAVKATIQGKEVPGQISSLFPHIQPGVDQGGSDLVAATKANAMVQARLLRESSTVISGMVKSGGVKVTSGYYDVGTGTVTLLE